MGSFMKRSAGYLLSNLNRGSFSGVAGATQDMVLKLQIASDLIYVVRYCECRGKPGVLAC